MYSVVSALLYCCSSEYKCSVRIWCLTSEARKSEATAKDITNVWLGRASGSTEVITTDCGGSILIAEDHCLLIEDQADKDITTLF